MLPRFIFSRYDGLVSSTQVALQTIPNVDVVWTTFLVPFFHEKQNQTLESRFVYAELMDHRECKPVRKFRFVYDNSEASKSMLEQILNTTTSDMSSKYALSPSSTGPPKLIDMSSGEEISFLQLRTDSFHTHLPLSSFRYVYVTEQAGRATEQVFLKPVDESGSDVFYQLVAKLRDYFRRVQTSPAIVNTEMHELVDHVDCGRVDRFFLHYEDNPESYELLFNILSRRRGVIRTTLRITFVPRTSETEALLRKKIDPVKYPCLIDASTGAEHVFLFVSDPVVEGSRIALEDAIRAFIHRLF